MTRTDRWSGVTEAYRRSFAGLCAGTIGELLRDLPPGRLLDVGCGTGDLLGEALRQGWDATGIDADADMVAIAGAKAPGRALHARLPELPFEDGRFDAVAANFVLNHVPDPRAALAEIARVTRPGGVVAATIWPPGGGGWSTLVGLVFAAAGATPMPTSHLPPHLDFERSTRGLAALAVEAGLEVVDGRELMWTWQVAPDDLWAGISGGVATVGQTYLAQDEDTRRRVEAEFAARAEPDDGLLTFTNRAALVLARR